MDQPAGAFRVVGGSSSVADAVFSPDGRYLYTSDGSTIRAFSTADASLLTSWSFGAKLGAIDLSADGQYLVVADQQAGPTRSEGSSYVSDATIYRLNTATGAVQAFTETSTSYGSAFFDIAYQANGLLLVNRTNGFGAYTTLDFTTGEFSRPAYPSYSEQGTLTTTADDRYTLIMPGNVSDAPVYVYTSGVGITATHGGYEDNVSGFNWGVQAISPDGSLIVQGLGLNVYNQAADLQFSLSGLYPEFGGAFGLSFSKDGQTLYLLTAQLGTPTILGLSTNDWSLTASYQLTNALGDRPNAFGNELVASQDGRFLSVIGRSGVEVVDLTVAQSAPTTPGDDVIVSGTSTFVYGLGGNDRIEVNGTVYRVRAGAGDDVIKFTAPPQGERATGYLDGGSGVDTLDVSGVAAIVQGAPGGFQIKIGTVDYLVTTIEKLQFGSSADMINFSIGDLSALEVRGGAGADMLQGGPNMTLLGEEGDDSFTVGLGGTGATRGYLDGGLGNDTLRIASGVTVDLTTRQAHAGAATYMLAGIENVLATVAGTLATAIGDEGANRISVNPFRDDGVAGVVFNGRGGDDVLSGSAGADQLMGGAENDVLEGRRGNDLLDGGAGVDVAVYDGLFRRSSANSTAVSGSEGTDTLVSIERLSFKDGDHSFDENDAWAQVVRIYDTVLQRQPDPDGLDFHTGRITSGQRSLFDVATDFLNSGEFQAATGGLNNQQFARFIYQTALDREPDAGGLAYWTGQLDSGVSRASMLALFSESAEHRALTAPSLAQGYFTTDVNYQNAALLYDTGLGRLPDAGGVIFWGDALKSGQQTIASMSAAFAGSAEFQTRTAGFSNGQLVDYMYQNSLDRPGDAGGRAYWTAQLEAGLAKADLLTNFAFSGEHRVLLDPFIDHGIVVI